jgi:hypothetical protein
MWEKLLRKFSIDNAHKDTRKMEISYVFLTNCVAFSSILGVHSEWCAIWSRVFCLIIAATMFRKIIVLSYFSVTITALLGCNTKSVFSSLLRDLRATVKAFNAITFPNRSRRHLKKTL